MNELAHADLLTPEEVAERFNLPVSVVDKMLEVGILESVVSTDVQPTTFVAESRGMTAPRSVLICRRSLDAFDERLRRRQDRLAGPELQRA